MMKKNDVYKGFKVLDIVDIPDYDSVGYWLRHEKMGMEVFKMLNKDEENTFSFVFKTPCEDSTGVAHVLEHSVLCGSERYPLKDPFIKLEQQSVNTYLNAFTASNHTAFPGASPVKKDFYNIFSIYADAVFFPLLRPEIFSQECHRLELDKDGKPSIQGVVYNEMKGAYSSFDRVASDVLDLTVLSGTEYEFVSGGDPSVIPTLTHEKLKAFHKKYYCTANCLVYLYGDIPLEEELDFLDENVLSRITDPGQSFDLKTCRTPLPMQRRVKAYGPAEEGMEDPNRRVVSVVWKLPDEMDKESPTCVIDYGMKYVFLDVLLWGDDSSPVCKKMLSSNIGVNLSSFIGSDCSTPIPYAAFSMEGVKEGDEEKFKDLLLDELKRIAKEGFAKNDFEKCEVSFEISNRSIKRPSGNPFSISILHKVLRGWIFGNTPWDSISQKNAFEKVKKAIDNNPNYLTKLIEDSFINNDNWTLVSIDPSAQWTKDVADKERSLAESRLKELGKERVLAEYKKMLDFQSLEEDYSVLPHLKLTDLPTEFKKTQVSKIDMCGIPVFVTSEPTNGLSYFNLRFPIDTLSPEEYLWCKLLGVFFGSMGRKGESWADFIAKELTLCSGFRCSVVACAVNPSKDINDDLFIGRDWCEIHVKTLSEKMDEALDLLTSYIGNIDFYDEKRVKDIVQSLSNDLPYTVISSAHRFALNRALSDLTKYNAVGELVRGIPSVLFMKKLASMDIKEICSSVEAVYKKVLKNGVFITINAAKDCIDDLKCQVEHFLKKNTFTAPCPRPASNFEIVKKYNEAIWEDVPASQDDDLEVFIIPGTVGYASRTLPMPSPLTKEGKACDVYNHLLSTDTLWNKVRMEGGAYGVNLCGCTLNNSSYFVTYRDPKPFDSIEAFKSAILEDDLTSLDQEDLEILIIGYYSRLLAPESPAARANDAVQKILSGEDEDMYDKIAKFLLSLTKEDLIKACETYKENIKVKRKSVVICPKSFVDDRMRQSTGKIFTMPL